MRGRLLRPDGDAADRARVPHPAERGDQPVVLGQAAGHATSICIRCDSSSTTASRSTQALPEAYERLLFDALRGDATLFMRSDELEAAWEFVTPILEAGTRLAAAVPKLCRRHVDRPRPIA